MKIILILSRHENFPLAFGVLPEIEKIECPTLNKKNCGSYFSPIQRNIHKI